MLLRDCTWRMWQLCRQQATKCPTHWEVTAPWLTSESGWVRVTLKACPLSWPRMWLFRLYWLLNVFSQPSLGQLNGFSPIKRAETQKLSLKSWCSQNNLYTSANITVANLTLCTFGSFFSFTSVFIQSEVSLDALKASKTNVSLGQISEDQQACLLFNNIISIHSLGETPIWKLQIGNHILETTLIWVSSWVSVQKLALWEGCQTLENNHPILQEGPQTQKTWKLTNIVEKTKNKNKTLVILLIIKFNNLRDTKQSTYHQQEHTLKSSPTNHIVVVSCHLHITKNK